MGILEWTTLETPGSSHTIIKELFNPSNKGSGINKIVISSDGKTIWAIVRRGDRNGLFLGGAQVTMYKSTDNGISWNENPYIRLTAEESSVANGTFIWDIAIAPDNPDVVAVACADIVKNPLHQEIWITTDGGNIWKNTDWPSKYMERRHKLISTMDISVYTNGHKILVGTRDGKGIDSNNLNIITISEDGIWNVQDASGKPPSIHPIAGDILTVKFSPTFSVDPTIVVVYTSGSQDHAGTWLATGIHDVAKNSTKWQTQSEHVELKNPRGQVGDSPHVDEIITVQLQLPFDFDGQNANSRRFYISTDATERSGVFRSQRGIYRIDDKAITTLMDTSNTSTKRICSIAYFGTCKSGKLLAGEVLGYSSIASVPTWFTYSPEGKVEEVWFPSLKSTTGAANLTSDTTPSTRGYGNAQISWASDGHIAFVATGSASLGPWAYPISENGSINDSVSWPAGYINVIPFDESAFSLSRNNGETWNQLSIINTAITNFDDVAPTPDGRTIYLASTNKESPNGFDSIWRSSNNPDIAAPLPILPIGTYWERIFTHVSTILYQEKQNKVNLLRTVPYCADPQGEIICWAAQGTKAQAYSPDFGDYWSIVVPRDIIQDFCFESRFVLYDLSPSGSVQKIVYGGSGWTGLLSRDSGISKAHTIAAYPEGKVLVGAAADYHRAYYAVSFSNTMNTDNPIFQIMTAAGKTPFMGNVHVTFHSNFTDNNMVFISDEANLSDNDIVGGSIYRQNIFMPIKWEYTDMLKFADSTSGIKKEYKQLQTGIVFASTGEALYSSYVQYPDLPLNRLTGILRTIDDGTGCYGPLSGIPQPGIHWDNLKINTKAEQTNVGFGAQPTAIKIAGCCSLDTDTILYAIDTQEYFPSKNRGMLWSYTDCIAKKGPQLVTSDGISVGCNIMTGKNREIIFAWDTLRIAGDYQIQIARDPAFSALVADTGVFTPASLTAPAYVYPGGGGITVSATVQMPSLECGQTYYWRCKAYHTDDGVKLQSPWSDVRSFTIEDISSANRNIILPISTTGKREEFKLLPGKKYHFFIAHAYEDKDWAGPFANYLRRKGYEIWYDDFIIKVGHSIRDKVDEGLSQSQYGILILSHNFFKKGKTWTRRELDGLTSIEDAEGRRLILPIWHNLDKPDITKYSPSLAGIKAANSNMGYQTVANIIVESISA